MHKVQIGDGDLDDDLTDGAPHARDKITPDKVPHRLCARLPDTRCKLHCCARDIHRTTAVLVHQRHEEDTPDG